MTTQTKQSIPWYLWPFAAIWKRALSVIVEMTGRFVAMVLGIVFIIIGVIVKSTIVGAIGRNSAGVGRFALAAARNILELQTPSADLCEICGWSFLLGRIHLGMPIFFGEQSQHAA